jgi:uncharacterized membrane protein
MKNSAVEANRRSQPTAGKVTAVSTPSKDGNWFGAAIVCQVGMLELCSSMRTQVLRSRVAARGFSPP